MNPDDVIRNLLVLLFTVGGIDLGLAFLMRGQRESVASSD